MKIALLHYAAPPVVGGVESVIFHHACLMADAGHHVSILAGRGEQTHPRISFVSIPLVDSRNPQILAAKTELDAGKIPAQFEILTSELVGELSKHLSDVDVLIAHNVCSLNKNLPLTAALKRIAELPGAPRLLLWHHDLAWTTPRYRAELYAGYPWDLLRSDWKMASQIVVSESRRQELAQLLGVPAARIIVVPNGVDAAQFLKLEKQTQEFVTKLDLLAANPLLLLPVRITPRKNIELAIRSLAVLQTQFPKAALVVTGPLGAHNPANAAYFDSLREQRASLGIDNSIHFLAEHTQAYLPDAVIADFYRLADALLLPSREEGFGIPILEAGLAGLPIFCSDIPPLHNLAGNFAAYFPPDAEPEKVADLISHHISANHLFRLRSKVKLEYTWQRIFSEQIQPLLETNWKEK